MNTSQIKQAAFLHRDPDASALPDMEPPREQYVEPKEMRRRATNLEIFAVFVIVLAIIELIWFR